MPRLGGPFFLVNADVLCSVDLVELAAQHLRLRRRHGVHVTLTVFPEGPPGEKYREILVDSEQGLVRGLGAPSFGKPYFVGVAVVEPEALAGVPSEGPAEFVPTVLQPALERGKAGVYLARGQWHDVGSPELWLRTHLAMIRGLETGLIPRAWRERIEGAAVRVGPECWVGRGSSRRVPADWVGPAFWSGPGSPPRGLGPDAVLYGAAAEAGIKGRGIGLDGIWAPLVRADS